jgi:SAM-dependent methyltransferase
VVTIKDAGKWIVMSDSQLTDMKYNQKEFWENRLKSFSHTGWSDPVVYAYDQEERLSIIRNYLDTLEFENKNALDFGCGTGDFSAVLLEKGFHVWATDPYVVPQFSSAAFNYSSDFNESDIPDNSLCLILTVTVLDHIIDRSELDEILHFFKKKIHPSGYLIMMEYALEKHHENPPNNNYQSFRTLEEWENILRTNGFYVIRVTNIPHPLNNPSPGYLHYRNNFIVKWLSNVAVTFSLRKIISPVLRTYAKSILRKKHVTALNVNESPLKLLTVSSCERNS